MTAIVEKVPLPRRPLQGVVQIFLFNWPFYVVGSVVVLACLLILATINVPPLLAVIAWTGTTIGGFWLLASLATSYWVYDASGLCEWRWIASELPASPVRWINIHCGFDESSNTLKAIFPHSTGQSLDMYDEREMFEPSIRRARKLFSSSAERVDYRRLPLRDSEVDVVFLLFSAHELRTSASRAVLLREVNRVLRFHGCAVVAEHLRDTPNFLAFGPGFLHFHSRAQWLETFHASKLKLTREFCLTPFVNVFILRRTS